MRALILCGGVGLICILLNSFYINVFSFSGLCVCTDTGEQEGCQHPVWVPLSFYFEKPV